MSEAAKGNKHCLGIKHSEETRKKLSKIRKGHQTSNETRNKISKALIGHQVSDETRNKIRKTLKSKATWQI